MPGEINIGGIVGYLNLNRSAWSAEIDAAKQQARDLGKENPKINIETNAPKALAELEAVAVATKRLQDAQGKLGVAQSKLNDLEEAGVTSGSKFVKAQEDVAKAMRDVELQQIRVTKAFDGGGTSAKKLGDNLGDAMPNMFSMQVLAPAVAAGLILIGPAAAVAGAGLVAAGLGALGLKDTVVDQLTPSFHQLEDAATGALQQGLGDGLDQARQAIPKLIPLIQVFGNETGKIADDIAHWLNDGGIKTFTEYAEDELPHIEGLFKSMSGAAGQFIKDTKDPANGLLDTLTGILTTLTGIGAARDKSAKQIAGPTSADKGVKGFFGSIEDAFLRGKPEALLTGAGIGANWLSEGAGKVTGALGGFFDSFSNKKGKSDIAATAAAVDEVGQSATRMAADMQDAAANTMAAQNQVAQMAKQAPNANTAMQGLLGSLATYAGSAGTAADKGALLGSVLRASQGDALSYAGAISQGYDAFHSLVLTFQQQTKDTQLGVTSFRDTEKAAIDLKTGLINLKATGAAPLVQQLQAMQDGAVNAATALYQHEVATKGESAALQDAQNIFESMTRGTLVDNAKQLGLTAQQAQQLADQYFSFDGKTVSTTVQSIGLNDINTTLQAIGALLAKLTGQTWTIPLDVSAQGLNNPGGLHDVVNNIPTKARAAGGPLGQGDTIVGEDGFELIRNGYVYNHSQAQAMLGVRAPAIGSFAGRSASASYTTPPASGGTFHGTTYVVLDGKVVATSVNEYNLAQGRR